MVNKRTKIVCTLGPSCETVETMTAMVEAGMNVARLNFSHGTYENHAMLMEHVRTVAHDTGEPIAILQDLQGPKIRVGELPEDGVVLEDGASVVFDTGIDAYADGVIPVDYTQLHTFVQPGERMLLNDGRSEVSITAVDGTRITTNVVVGGTITSHKGLNVPDSAITARALTQKDKEDAKFGVEHGVDMIALSFVRTPEDILDLRYWIKECEKELSITPANPIRIIAKIERREAVEQIAAILDVADGIMVARGDLGIEIPAEEVPLVQKRLIDAALDHARPVIVATQMLDSMQHSPRPTRAEVSDVANAVIDHTDAVMLSNETATGKYPVQVVETMSRIVVETEKSHYDDLHQRDRVQAHTKVDDTISHLSRTLAEDIGATVIVAASLSGETGRLISRHRPQLPIVVASSTERVQHQLNLSWGVVPVVILPCQSIEELVERSEVQLKRKQLVAVGDKMVVVAGEPVGHAGHVNLLEVRTVS